MQTLFVFCKKYPIILVESLNSTEFIEWPDLWPETLAEDETEEESSRFEGGEKSSGASGEKLSVSNSNSNSAGSAARGITRAREILEREDDTVRPLEVTAYSKVRCQRRASTVPKHCESVQFSLKNRPPCRYGGLNWTLVDALVDSYHLLQVKFSRRQNLSPNHAKDHCSHSDIKVK